MTVRLLLIATLAASCFAQDDPVLALAKRVASEYSANLPDYVCQERIERYGQVLNNLNRSYSRRLDTVTAEVVNEHGVESFRNLRVDGRVVEKADGGLWSIGIFGPLMASLFEPRIGAQFQRRGIGKELGRRAVRFSFLVSAERSNWQVVLEGQPRAPAYRGDIWVEETTGRILRHEIVAPEIAPTKASASMRLRYGFAKINGMEYLLPAHAESELCLRVGQACDRSVSTYTNCRKFGTEAILSFETDEPAR